MSKVFDQIMGIVHGRNGDRRPANSSPAFDEKYRMGRPLPGHPSEDLEALNLLTGSRSHIREVDRTRPRTHHPGSLFARECMLAYMMGFDDGMIGRPRPENTSKEYENGYERGTLKSIAGPQASRRHKRSQKPKDRSKQRNPFAQL